MCMCLIYASNMYLTHTKLLLLHPSSFNGKPLCFLLYSIGECSNTVSPCTWITFSYSTATQLYWMALHMKNDHIRYYCMDSTWSVDLVLCCSCHPEYLVIQCKVHAMLLIPDSVTQTGPYVHHFVNFFPRCWVTHQRESSVIVLWLL